MSEDEKATIKYFWTEKGDVTRWCEWDEHKEEIRKTNPELVAAVDNLVVAKLTLTAIVRSL